MYDRFLQVDDLTRGDHTYIQADDKCYHLGEFTSHSGYMHSDTNQLINNLKKPVDRRGRPEWKYKEQAIQTIASDLRKILGQAGIEGVTYVPMPSSKIKSDPLYDDRLVRILSIMGQGYQLDLRELLIQNRTIPASHESSQRATQQELSDSMSINEVAVNPAPSQIIIFDDVLTTGRHFKVAQQKLSARFPGVGIFGLFVARRILPSVADTFSTVVE